MNLIILKLLLTALKAIKKLRNFLLNYLNDALHNDALHDALRDVRKSDVLRGELVSVNSGINDFLPSW